MFHSKYDGEPLKSYANEVRNEFGTDQGAGNSSARLRPGDFLILGTFVHCLRVKGLKS